MARSIQSNAALAAMVAQVAKAAGIEVVICATESGEFARELQLLTGGLRLIPATTDRETFEALNAAGMQAIRLPLRSANKYNQIRHIISVALRSGEISVGDTVICAIGCDVYPEEGNVVVVTDVEPDIENLAVSDLLKLTDGIRPGVIEAAINVACKIGRAARRGRRLGAIFVLGDSLKVLEGSKQLIPNPFHGHDRATRMLTNPDIHDALVELAKLDGAFVVRGDGFIQTAGIFLASPPIDIEVPSGLGARHVAAAAVTKRTMASSVVVSATDGNVRVFSDGRHVLHVDPDLAQSMRLVDD